MRYTLDGDPFELTPELVRASLHGHVPASIRDCWVGIDGTRWPAKQVIPLTTGVHDRQWFQSQLSKRWLGNLGFMLVSGLQAAPPSAPAPSGCSSRLVIRQTGRSDQKLVEADLVDYIVAMPDKRFFNAGSPVSLALRVVDGGWFVSFDYPPGFEERTAELVLELAELPAREGE